MKNLILTVLITMICTVTNAQNFKALAKYEFKTEESYQSERNKVLECANYLFNNPVVKDDINRLVSIQYIIKWMSGTPDYTFDITKEVTDLIGKGQKLMGLYLAGMTKVVLEDDDKELSSDEIYSKVKDLLVAYCSDPKNNIKPSKAIKKIIKSKNKA